MLGAEKEWLLDGIKEVNSELHKRFPNYEPIQHMSNLQGHM